MGKGGGLVITCFVLCRSVADPDPKDQHHFAGSGFEIFFTDPDPDLNLQ